MSKAQSIDDAAFLAAFEDGSLPAAEFTHRNHLRAGWLYLEKFPLPEATRCCALAIQRYAATLGLPGKFHLTLTLAFMHIISHRRRQHAARSWRELLSSCPELEHGARALIAVHYSDALLRSERARKTFVPPDRQPLPAP